MVSDTNTLKEVNMGKLKNPRQELFCQYYVTEINGKLYNATGAAIKAKYSEKTARQIASKLLTNVNIKNRIEELRNEAIEKIGIDRLYMLNKYKKIIEGRLSDYMEWKTVKKKGPYGEYTELEVEFKDSKDVDDWNITEFTKTKDGFKFKTHCKDKAMAKLSEFMKLFETQEERDNMKKVLEQLPLLSALINNPVENRSFDDE